MFKLYEKKCKQCDRIFYANHRNQRYCSKKCREVHHELMSDYRLDSGRGQMCWRCGNACGKCSWSREGKPVEGWKARKTTIKNRGKVEFHSYNIIFCPEFVQDVEVRVHNK